MDMANLLACHVESHLRRFEAATSRSHHDVVSASLQKHTSRNHAYIGDEPSFPFGGYCQVGQRSGVWQGRGHEHDIQSVPRLPLSR